LNANSNINFKTFSDFARLAHIIYRLPQQVAELVIESKLRERGLSTTAAVAYINWASGDCLTQKQIGQHLGITQQAVDKHLSRLKAVWPHLFEFGLKPPRTVTNRRGKKPIPLDMLNDETKIKRTF